MYLSRVSTEDTDRDQSWTYWSKNGSKIITSSPCSRKPMNALNIPSFAPVVIVTSVSGLIDFPKNGEYALAIAFFSLGRP